MYNSYVFQKRASNFCQIFNQLEFRREDFGKMCPIQNFTKKSVHSELFHADILKYRRDAVNSRYSPFLCISAQSR
jgi:hypothetical protein